MMRRLVQWFRYGAEAPRLEDRDRSCRASRFRSQPSFKRSFFAALWVPNTGPAESGLPRKVQSLTLRSI
jgi:hypothetical protein